jgi:hypothetical protein
VYPAAASGNRLRPLNWIDGGWISDSQSIAEYRAGQSEAAAHRSLAVPADVMDCRRANHAWRPCGEDIEKKVTTKGLSAVAA